MASKQLEDIFRLWDELADFEAGDTERAMFHLMKSVCNRIGADNAIWIGGVRMRPDQSGQCDTQHGWRARVVQHWRATPALHQLSVRAMREQDIAPAMTTTAIVARAGMFRAHRLYDGFVNVAAFKRTAHYRVFYKQMGISDRMWIAFPLNADAESYFVFDRYRRVKKFTKAEENLAASVLRGVKWFHRQLMLHQGLLLAKTPLTAVEQKIVSRLLTDKAEKEIAHELGQSFHTTHWYVREIYRKFGVNGRAGLMALWLKKG